MVNPPYAFAKILEIECPGTYVEFAFKLYDTTEDLEINSLAILPLDSCTSA